MHHIKQDQIPLSKRRPYLAKYKRQLAEALVNPNLTEEAKQRARAKLDALRARENLGG